MIRTDHHGRHAGTLQAVLLLLTATLSVMTLALLAPVLPQMKQHFAVGPNAGWLVPTIITMPSLFLVICAPFAGMMADRFGKPRKLLLIALLSYALVGTAPFYLNSIGAILLSRVFVGIAEAAVITFSTTLVSQYFRPRDRDRWLGYQSAITSSSAIVFAAVGGVLGAGGWRAPFVLYGSSVPLMVGIWATTRRTPTYEVIDRLAASPSLFPWQRVLKICALTLFTALLFFAVQLNGSLALVGLGVTSPPRIGLLLALATIGAPAGSVLFRLTLNRSLRRRLVVAYLIAALGLCLTRFARTPPVLVAAIFLTDMGCNVALPSLLTNMVRGAAPEFRSRGIGLWQSSLQLGQFSSPFIISFVGRRFGGLTPALFSLGAAAASLALGTLLTPVHLPTETDLSARDLAESIRTRHIGRPPQ